MSKTIDLRTLLISLSNLDVHNPDSIGEAAKLLMIHINTYPEEVEDVLNALANYFRKHLFVTEMLYAAVNKIKNSEGTFNSIIYTNGVNALLALKDKAIFGPSPMDIDELINMLDNIDKTPENIAQAPSKSRDLIKNWLICRLPYSQTNGYILKMLERFQKAFEYNPVRLAILNRAFAQLTDLASRDPNLLGWLTYSLNETPKLKSISEASTHLANVINTIPEFYDICQNLDNINKDTPEPDASVMLLLAKWLHANIQDDTNVHTIIVLFDTLAERYQNNEQMLTILNTALKNLYELSAGSDEPGLAYINTQVPKPCIGPAPSEVQILIEQLEYWFKEQNIQGATQVMLSWLEVHTNILSIHPEIKSKVYNSIRHQLKDLDLYTEMLDLMFKNLNQELYL